MAQLFATGIYTTIWTLPKKFGGGLRQKLWGGHLWNPSYFISTVSDNTEEQVRKYIQSQGKKH